MDKVGTKRMKMLFEAEECIEIAAVFGHELWKNGSNFFSKTALDNGICTFASDLHNDPGAPELWLTLCGKIFGKGFSPKDCLTLDQIFTVFIEYSAYYTYKFGFDELEELLHLLFKIRYTPDQCEQELKLWKNIVSDNSDTPLYFRSLPESEMKPTIVLDDSTTAVFHFIDGLAKKSEKHFSLKTLDAITKHFIEPFRGKQVPSQIVAQIYGETFGGGYGVNDPITIPELFTTLIELCALYIYQLNAHLEELLHLLLLIRYNPEKYPNETALWQKTTRFYETLEEEETLN